MIECREDGYTLTDLDSKHGTLLNGEPVNGGMPLEDGALVRLGHTELRFRSYRPTG